MAKFDKDVFLSEMTDKVKDAIESGLISQNDISNDDVDRLTGFLQYALSDYIDDRKAAIDILRDFNYDERYSWEALENQVGGKIKSLFDIALANLWKFLEASGLMTYAYYIDGVQPEQTKPGKVVDYSEDEFDEDTDLAGEVRDEDEDFEDFEDFEDEFDTEEDFIEDNDEVEDIEEAFVKNYEDYLDDEDEQEVAPSKKQSAPKVREPEPEFDERAVKKAPTPNKVTPISRPVRRSNNTTGMEVCVIKPTSVEEAREITETLLANRTVVLNLEGLDVEIAQRIIDFTSGSCYAINGNLQKISNYIFIITPQTVEISGDFQDIFGGGSSNSDVTTF
jgi:cell division inhibitor SepF